MSVLKKLQQERARSFKGRTKEESLHTGKCVTCDEPDLNFVDALSSKEYTISGMCQTCQDKVFK